MVPTPSGTQHGATECTKGGCKPMCCAGYAWCGLNPLWHEERRCLIGQPSSRTGENPPYGMIGEVVETSASFQARYRATTLPGGQREPAPAKRVPDTEPERRAQCARAGTSSSKAG